MSRFLSSLLALGLLSSVADAAPGKRLKPLNVPGGIVQLTGKSLRVGQTTFKKRGLADPFVDFRADGKVRLYGTITSVPRGGKHTYLEYASVDDFMAGRKYETKGLDLAPGLIGKEKAWDFMTHTWPSADGKGGEEVLYAGVMTPTARRTKHAHWPDDNWTRRIYAFTKGKDGKWQMNPRAVFNPVTRDTKASMIGHTYGHHFKEIEVDGPNGPTKETWLFHEEISGEVKTPQGPRLKTEIFARKMLSPTVASEEKVKILGVGNPPRYGRRSSGEYLVEGPRPFDVTIKGERYHFVTFSGADFAGDGYDIHFAYRKGGAIGPYTPLTEKGTGGMNDKLISYAAKLKARHGLSWVGRADIKQKPDGGYIAVFHGVRKDVHPEADYSGGKIAPEDLSKFHRNVYVVPVELGVDKRGVPTIELVDDPNARG